MITEKEKKLRESFIGHFDAQDIINGATSPEEVRDSLKK